MAYLPEPKVSRFTRWTYPDSPGWSTEDLMQPDPGLSRSVSPGWHRMPERRRSSVIVRSDGIAIERPKTFAAALGKKNYALRCELGERAYAALTGARVRRTPKARVVVEAKVVSPPPEARASGAVLVTDDLAKRLGLVVRMGEVD